MLCKSGDLLLERVTYVWVFPISGVHVGKVFGRRGRHRGVSTAWGAVDMMSCLMFIVGLLRRMVVPDCSEIFVAIPWSRLELSMVILKGGGIS